jgi:hypothetical protein
MRTESEWMNGGVNGVGLYSVNPTTLTLFGLHSLAALMAHGVFQSVGHLRHNRT